MLDLRSQLTGVDQLLARSPSMEARLAQTLTELDRDARRILEQECPFRARLEHLNSAEIDLVANGIGLAQLAEWLPLHEQVMAECGRPPKSTFWATQLTQLRQRHVDPTPLARLLLKEQRTALEKAQAQWRLARLAALRADYLARLQAWLDTLIALSRRYQSLGLDPGVLVDFSDGVPLQQTEAALTRWADYLAGNPGILALCQRIGQHRQPQTQTTHHRVTRRVPCWRPQPNAPAPDELFGLLPGRELPQLLPSEWAQLGDPELATLFELKYLESKLLAYQRRGWQSERQWREETRWEPCETVRAKGPMVIAVDTSLSMQGTPETAAKAIALTLAATARAENRPVHLINFATAVAEQDLSQSGSGLLPFLQLSFHGGTDVAIALEATLETLENPDYELADLVLLSDMVLADLPVPLLERLNRARQSGHQIHAVAIGEVVRESSLIPALDCQWQFNPEQGDIDLKKGEAPAAAVATPLWQGLAGSA